MPLKWRKQWISDEDYESAGVADVDGDGVLDIVSGAFWYQGPDFRRKHALGTIAKHGEYYDDFSTILMDLTGNGLPDVVGGGWWGKTLRWHENPGEPGSPWPEHAIAEVGSIETTRAYDIDGDGHLEILPNTPGRAEVAYYTPIRHAGVATGEFREVVVHRFAEGKQGHGLGCGDVAGNGRMDIVLGTGWLEAPADPATGEWVWHPDFVDAPWGWSASVPMLVVDVDGDGVNEIITGNGHGYGLWWSKRHGEGDAQTWTHHPIDLWCSQYHDLQWLDIDGDGVPELITGKRHRAHCGNDVGEWDDLGIYYFKWTGEGFAKQVIDYGPIGQANGCGIHFAVADLNGNGRLDVVAPGKGGLYVYINEGP